MDDQENDALRHTKAGVDSGADVAQLLLNEAKRGGFMAVRAMAEKLTENQAKWALVALVWFHRTRIEDIAEDIGRTNPNMN